MYCIYLKLGYDENKLLSCTKQKIRDYFGTKFKATLCLHPPNPPNQTSAVEYACCLRGEAEQLPFTSVKAGRE